LAGDTGAGCKYTKAPNEREKPDSFIDVIHCIYVPRQPSSNHLVYRCPQLPPASEFKDSYPSPQFQSVVFILGLLSLLLTSAIFITFPGLLDGYSPQYNELGAFVASTFMDIHGGDAYNYLRPPYFTGMSIPAYIQCAYAMQWMPFMQYQGFPPVTG
jgi:hypothetical protein